MRKLALALAVLGALIVWTGCPENPAPSGKGGNTATSQPAAVGSK